MPQAPADGAEGSTELQISHHDFNARTDIPYYHEDSEKQELLRISDALKDHRAEIAAFFEAHEGRKERGDFIKGFFDNVDHDWLMKFCPMTYRTRIICSM